MEGSVEVGKAAGLDRGAGKQMRTYGDEHEEDIGGADHDGRAD